MKIQSLNYPWRYVGLVLIIMLQVGCAGPSSQRDKAGACNLSENLLADTDFSFSKTFTEDWVYSQHTGESSFRITTIDGVVSMERVGEEPWMLLKQTLQSERIAGTTLVFTAELKGEALQGHFGFEPKAGLFGRIGTGGRAKMAPHQPNSGSWDWQTFSEKISLPATVDRIQVGFLHQTGGVLYARNPSLQIESCQ